MDNDERRTLDEYVKTLCPHFCSKDGCIYCNGDGSEVVIKCSKCNAGTWHRNNKCLRCGTENKGEIWFGV